MGSLVYTICLFLLVNIRVHIVIVSVVYEYFYIYLYFNASRYSLSRHGSTSLEFLPL